MIIQMIPLFEKGNVLTEEMLQACEQYSLDYVNLTYDGYSDGIVRGLELDAADGLLTIGRGIIRLGHETYFVTRESQIEYEPVKQENALKLVFRDETRTRHFLYREAELVLSGNLEKRTGELELCRFKLQEGARLRNDYQNFSDYNTEFDTVNIIHADWASYERETISPVILRAFVKEAVTLGVTEAPDITFCQQVLSLKGESINRDALDFYIQLKLEKDVKNCSGKELYDKLKEILMKLKNKPKTKEEPVARRQRFIIN